MTTPAAVLREVIDGAIAKAHPEPLGLQEIYRAVEAEIRLDADDLRPIPRRRAPTEELAWHRSVRTILEQSRAASTLVNIRSEEWRLPTPDPGLHVDESTAWELVRIAAEKALSHDVVYVSTKQGQRYQVREIDSSRLSIHRLDSRADATVTTNEIARAIRHLNAAGGRLGRTRLIGTVAKEVSIVFLHPRLAWSEDREWIEVVGAEAPAPARPIVYRDFGEAPDDDPGELAQFARRVRRGQPKFRRNLIELYGGRCAITGWAPAAVLEAAHVRVHADSGINDSKNGILLRADLHALFDDGLLKIEPETRTVVIHPSLAETPYWTLNGTALRPRMDSSQPSSEYLWERWRDGAL